MYAQTLACVVILLAKKELRGVSSANVGDRPYVFCPSFEQLGLRQYVSELL